MRDLTMCPNGHKHTLDDDGTPVCVECELIATHFNGTTRVVYEWTPVAQYQDNCQRLQDAMDEAFDNTFFNEW